MEAEKLNNGNRKSGSCEAGFFYRRIGGTVYKIRVLTSENSTDTLSDKISPYYFKRGADRESGL